MDAGRIFIFLDIDGVLNTSAQWKRMYSLDDKCIAQFAEYIKSLPAGVVRIILISSWKAGFDPAGRHSPQILDLIRKLAVHGLSVIGRTEDDPDGDRAKEVNDFIRKHRLEKDACIVIDDDLTLFRTKLASNCTLLLTDARVGFQKPKEPAVGSFERLLRFFRLSDEQEGNN